MLCEIHDEFTEAQYLRDLSERIFKGVTPAQGIDQSDCDQLNAIAQRLEKPMKPILNAAPDLLVALTACVDDLQFKNAQLGVSEAASYSITLARVAIAKATQ